MKILVACEFSGVVRNEFISLGHDAWSCDLLPTDSPGPHIEGDVLEVLNYGWDLMVAHPPCTYLSNSGVSHLYKSYERWKQMIDGACFFRELLHAPIPKIAVENPIMHGYAKKIIGKEQDQIIQPWMFGHPDSKATCFWLKNLPLLKKTNVLNLPKSGHWENQTSSGQNKLPPSDDRWKLRSITFKGIAKAIADQWQIN